MAEFAWSAMEMHQDHFTVEFFVDAIEKLNRNDIQTILCTPTATPPIWISHNHAERMFVDHNGVAMVHGGRQHVCTNHAYVRERARLIISKMAKTYGRMPGVIAWQLDNELKGNVSECFCDTCRSLWHTWLLSEYQHIDMLNERWGTHIWSQHYHCFEQVPQPLKTPMGQNPSLVTAYGRFSREMAAVFLKEQAEVIRNDSDLPITHNTSLNHDIDNEKAFDALDFASFDHYSTSSDYGKMLSWMDTFKTLKGNTPFWVMETAPTFSGSIYGYQTIHQNGYIQAEASAAYALGAEGFCYWLWRQHRTGVEQPHGHIVSCWGEPGIGFEQVAEAGKFKKELERVFSCTTPATAEIAVTYSDEARLYFLTEPLEVSGFDYIEEMTKWHERFVRCGMHRDLLFENRELSGYKIILTPFLPYLSASFLKKAKEFVAEGGIWIVGPLTGMRTKDQTVHTDAALGELESYAGVKTVFHFPVTGSGVTGTAFGCETPLSLWSAAFHCMDAIEMGKMTGGSASGLSFVTECNRGKGKIVMLGSMPAGENGNTMLEHIIRHYAHVAGVKTYGASVGTIVIPRTGQDLDQWVLINLDGKGGTVEVPIQHVNAFSLELCPSGETRLKPYECKVIQFEPQHIPFVSQPGHLADVHTTGHK
jgi:beta-galactosidase